MEQEKYTNPIKWVSAIISSTCNVWYFWTRKGTAPTMKEELHSTMQNWWTTFQAKHLIVYSDGANDLQIKFDLNCAVVLKCSTFKKTNFVASYGAVNLGHNEPKCSTCGGVLLYGIVHFCMSKEVSGTISWASNICSIANSYSTVHLQKDKMYPAVP